MLFFIGFILLPLGLASGVLWLIFRKRTPTRWLAICFFIPGLLILAAVLPSPLPRSPLQVYQDLFGHGPRQGTTVVRTSIRYSQVSREAFLELRLTPEALSVLLNRASPIEPSSAFGKVERGPRWWPENPIARYTLPSAQGFDGFILHHPRNSQTVYLYAFSDAFE